MNQFLHGRRAAASIDPSVPRGAKYASLRSPGRAERGKSALAVAIFACLSGTCAVAETTGAGDDRVADVVVTATKMDRPIRQVTDSVTIVTEADIKRANHSDTTEILRQTAGVEFKQAGGPGQFNYPKLRGFGAGHYLVVIDGVKINEAVSAGVGHVLGQIDPSLIERIEVLRGPQADLYGSDSTAGVIAITTKAPTPGTNLQVGGEVGSLDWKKGYASLRGTQGALGYSVNLAVVDSQGVHEQENYRSTSPQVKLSYNPGDSFSVEGSFLYMDTKFNFAELLESYAQDSAQTPWWAFQLPDPSQFNQNEQYLASLDIKHQLTGSLRQNLRFGWSRKTNSNRDDDDGLLGTVVAPTNDFSLDYRYAYARGEEVPVYDDGDGKSYNYRDENTQLDYNLILDTSFDGGENTTLLGYEWFRQAGRKWGKYGELSSQVDNTALYVNDVLLLLGGDLVLKGGMRLNEHEEFGSKTTSKLGVAYNFPTKTTLFANVGTSFRAPTFGQLYDAKYGNADLDPESGETTELGFRQSAFGGRMDAEATFWRTELDDVITFVGGIDPKTFRYTGTYLNRDQGYSQGAEFNISLRLTKKLTLKGNYTYTDAWSEEDGERFRTVQVARNKGNLGLDYVHGPFQLGGNLYLVGPRLRWAGDIETDGYARLDLYGRYQVSKTISLYARIENLFNSEIIEDLGYEQPGRYLLAGVDWQFGR
jgi:vitamin B12 transporter